MTKLVLNDFRPTRQWKRYQNPVRDCRHPGFQLDRGVVIITCNRNEDATEYAVLLRDYIWHKTRELWSVQYDERKGWDWKPTVHVITDARAGDADEPPPGAHPKLTPCNGFDEYDLTAARKLHPLHVFLRLEKRATPDRRDSLPTWRRWQPNHPYRRPQVILVDPDQRALDTIERDWTEIKNFLNIPALAITPTRPLPRNTPNWLDRAITPNQEAATFFRTHGIPAWVPNLSKAPEVQRRRKGKKPFTIAYAGRWGDKRRDRAKPGPGWPHGERPTHGLREALGANVYVILGREETYPWDGYLAAAHGAHVIAPNIGVYRGIPGVTLFPTFPGPSTTTTATWDYTATREWIRYAVRKIRRT